MSKVQKSKKAKVSSSSNRNILIFVSAFAIIGSVFVYRSFAAPAATIGSLTKEPSSTIQEPYVLDWSFNKGSKHLERPHVNLGCFRDQNGDGTIDTSSWQSPDLAYGSQSYLAGIGTFGEVVVTQDSRSSFKGTLTVDLLSGSSKLVNEPSTSKTVKCNAELRVWDGNLRQQTSGTVIDRTPFVTLTDTRN